MAGHERWSLKSVGDYRMTVEEFEEQKDTLACRHCGHIGLQSIWNANNNSIRPVCGACGKRYPLLDPATGVAIQYLRQRSAASRRLRRLPGEPTGPDVWEANGNHCAYCGKTREECVQYGIGLTAQHIIPCECSHCRDLDLSVSSPLVPFCSRCQQASAAALAETERIRHTVNSFKDQIEVLRRKQEALDRERNL